MKILDRYIARQLLGVTALGVMALSALLLLGNLFKELRPLLVENKAPISIVLEFILQVIPFSLMFSIPWGFLTAVLLVYGRLASDNELTSMRMSGMSLWRLSAPAIAIGIALSGLCYWINIDIAPRAKQSISELLIKAASINPKGLLNEGQAITKFDNLEIYIDKRADDVIHGMHIYQKADEKSPSVAMHSERVTMDFSPEKKILTLNLINPLITTQEEGSISQSVTMDEMPLSINLDKSRSRRDTSVEVFSAMRSEKAIRRADICLLVIDIAAGITQQDRRIAGIIAEEGKPCIIIVNKFDLFHPNASRKDRMAEV